MRFDTVCEDAVTVPMLEKFVVCDVDQENACIDLATIIISTLLVLY